MAFTVVLMPSPILGRGHGTDVDSTLWYIYPAKVIIAVEAMQTLSPVETRIIISEN